MSYLYDSLFENPDIAHTHNINASAWLVLHERPERRRLSNEQPELCGVFERSIRQVRQLCRLPDARCQLKAAHILDLLDHGRDSLLAEQVGYHPVGDPVFRHTRERFDMRVILGDASSAFSDSSDCADALPLGPAFHDPAHHLVHKQVRESLFTSVNKTDNHGESRFDRCRASPENPTQGRLFVYANRQACSQWNPGTIGIAELSTRN